ncbi:hypothetical protein RF11_05181 [Thelohanellus kitauei]|uniref:Uncharacterized protein n=1 Tax=Thelohanellus kitauei TaxID=669202 RepID=A0A0C2N1C0_THEKT|nr:hypothetical protein RF11_05181 [Thelohanellus kitauei]
MKEKKNSKLLQENDQSVNPDVNNGEKTNEDTWEQKTICCGKVFIGPQDQILIDPKFLKPHPGPCEYGCMNYLWDTGEILVETDDDNCSIPAVPDGNIPTPDICNSNDRPQNGDNSATTSNNENHESKKVVQIDENHDSNNGENTKIEHRSDSVNKELA